MHTDRREQRLQHSSQQLVAKSLQPRNRLLQPILFPLFFFLAPNRSSEASQHCSVVSQKKGQLFGHSTALRFGMQPHTHTHTHTHTHIHTHVDERKQYVTFIRVQTCMSHSFVCRHVLDARLTCNRRMFVLACSCCVQACDVLMYARTYAHLFVCEHVSMLSRLSLCMHAYIYRYIYIQIHMYVCMYVCMYVYTYVCMYVCMYVCILIIYIYIY